MVQCSYNHFPKLRAVMWPNGIEKLFDFYSTASLEVLSGASKKGIPESYTQTRKDVIESGEHPKQSTKAISPSA
jgi:hypothetical protein